MLNLDLRRDERIVYKTIKVKGVGLSKGYKDTLILTNYDLILVTYSGIFHKKAEIKKYSLADIKIIDGEAQAIYSVDDSGDPELELYFMDYTLAFQFSSHAKNEIKKWIKFINDVLETTPSETINGTDFIRPVAEGIVNTVLTGVDVVKKAINKTNEEFVTMYCTSCGAKLTGIKGKPVTCKYCKNRQTL